MKWSKKIKLYYEKAVKKHEQAKKVYRKAKAKKAKQKELTKLWKAWKKAKYEAKAWRSLLDWASSQSKPQKKTKKTKKKSTKTKAKAKSKAKKGTAKTDKPVARKVKSVKTKPAPAQAKKETKVVEATPAPPPITQAEPKPKPSVKPPTPTRTTRTRTNTTRKTVTPKPAGNAKDNLKKIEGIGPKIEQLLNQAGIKTWSALAGSRVSVLRKILAEAGPRFRMHNPSSWARQARLAAQGKWDQLKKLQDHLKGGK